MINQYTFQKSSGELVDIVGTVQEELILQIVRKLARGKTLDDEQWQLMMLQSMIPLQKDMQKTVRSSIEEQLRAIDTVNEKAVKIGLDDVDKQLASVTEASKTKATFFEVNEVALQEIGKKLTVDIEKANLTMLQTGSTDYIDIINKTLLKKEAGAITRQQALEQVVGEWSRKGLPSLIDKGGKRWSPEAYVDMVVRTNSLDIAKATQDRRAVDYNHDLILTSQHADQSDEHAPYANKIYSLSGNHPKYPPFSVATNAGFMTRPNCRHTYSFYIPGVTTKEKQLPKRETDKNYEESQKQRKLERDIRQEKRYINAQKALGNEVSTAKLKSLQSDMRAFIDDTGRTRQRSREQLA